jgi:hypothetical protein
MPSPDAGLHFDPEGIVDADIVIYDGIPRTLGAIAYLTCACVCGQWWDGELERGYLIHRARALHNAYTTHQEAPTRPVPGYLKARAEAGLALPREEMTEGQQNGAGWAGDRKRTRAVTKAHATGEPQCMHAVVGWVVNELNGELFTELMHGFHA